MQRRGDRSRGRAAEDRAATRSGSRQAAERAITANSAHCRRRQLRRAAKQARAIRLHVRAASLERPYPTRDRAGRRGGRRRHRRRVFAERRDDASFMSVGASIDGTRRGGLALSEVVGPARADSAVFERAMDVAQVMRHEREMQR